MKIREKDALKLAEGIISTIRQPFIVLDKDLRVITASRSFYLFFSVKPEKTEGKLIYNLGDNQWDIPKLRELLEIVLPNESHFENYIVEHNFETIGKHTMVLNACEINGFPGKQRMILLAFEDISHFKELGANFEDFPRKLETDKIPISKPLEYSQGILNTIRESLIVVDNDLRILFASHYFYKSFNLKPEKVVGKFIYDLHRNQEEICKIQELLESILPNQKTIENYEVEINFKMLGKRIMLINARQIQGLLGKEQIILLAIKDITEEKKLEEERIRSIAKFPDENPNPVLRFSKAGKILYVNKRSADILDKWDLSIGDYVPLDWKKQIDIALKSHEIVNFEEIYEDRIYRFTLAPLKELNYLNAYGDDITDRKHAEETIRETKALLEAVVENIPLMIFLKEAEDLRFVLFNNAGEELLGQDRKDLLGKNDWDLFPSEQAAHFIAKDREVLDGKTGALDILEEPILTSKRDERILHTHKVRILGADGKAKYLLGVSEDITEQMQSQIELKNSLNKLQETIKGTINTIALIVEARDPYTAGHQKRVSDLAAAIAINLHLSEHQVEGIRLAGLIHDLGKIQIPAEILSKPGKISKLEFEIIKTHPQVGYDLLKEINFPWPIAQIVHQHHEKIDGSGYPQGLVGDEIMLEARILAVSDIVEAMSSHRPYRPALGIEKALEEIMQDKGTLLDPDVVDVCVKLFEQGYHLQED